MEEKTTFFMVVFAVLVAVLEVWFGLLLLSALIVGIFGSGNSLTCFPLIVLSAFEYWLIYCIFFFCASYALARLDSAT